MPKRDREGLYLIGWPMAWLAIIGCNRSCEQSPATMIDRTIGSLVATSSRTITYEWSRSSQIIVACTTTHMTNSMMVCHQSKEQLQYLIGWPMAWLAIIGCNRSCEQSPATMIDHTIGSLVVTSSRTITYEWSRSSQIIVACGNDWSYLGQIFTRRTIHKS